MDDVTPIQLVKSIPFQIVNEGASYGLKMADFVKSKSNVPLRFSAELDNGNPLPKGLICTQEGLISGIPALDTHGRYNIQVLVEDKETNNKTIEFELTIKPRITNLASIEEFTQLKSQIWQAIKENKAPPKIMELLNRPISAAEIYYLLERFGRLLINDVYNFELPSEKKVMPLKGISPHFEAYDCGCALMVAPKDLFSHERTLADGLQSAVALAREVYERGWVIEFTGFNKFTHAAWLELQRLGDKNGKYLEIINYNPPTRTMEYYVKRVRNQTPGH